MQEERQISVVARTPNVHLVTGKCGSGISKSFVLDKVLQYEAADDAEELEARVARIEESIAKVRETNPTFEFEDNVMEVTCIVLNPALEARVFTVPIHKPTKKGGHEFGKNTELLKELCMYTHPHIVAEEDLHKTDIRVYAVRHAHDNILIIFPENRAVPAHLAKLDLAVHPSNPDVISAMRIRLNDGVRLGKSGPQICASKFKYLFPGVPLESAPKKRKREEPAAGDVIPEEQHLAVLEELVSKVAQQIPDGRSKASGVLIAHFLHLLPRTQATKHVLKTLTFLDSSTCVQVLARPSFLTQIAEHLGSEQAEEFAGAMEFK